MNRRHTVVVFNLEVDGTGVGRGVPVRVWSWPKRGREHDEKGREGDSEANVKVSIPHS